MQGFQEVRGMMKQYYPAFHFTQMNRFSFVSPILKKGFSWYGQLLLLMYPCISHLQFNLVSFIRQDFKEIVSTYMFMFTEHIAIPN